MRHGNKKNTPPKKKKNEIALFASALFRTPIFGRNGFFRTPFLPLNGFFLAPVFPDGGVTGDSLFYVGLVLRAAFKGLFAALVCGCNTVCAFLFTAQLCLLPVPLSACSCVKEITRLRALKVVTAGCG
jgi:hypothetical protein